VQTEPESNSTDFRQGDVVARQVNALESVNFLEMAEAILVQPLAIGEVLINEVSDPALGTRPYSLRDQRIGWRFVFVPHHGNNVHCVRLHPRLVGY